MVEDDKKEKKNSQLSKSYVTIVTSPEALSIISHLDLVSVGLLVMWCSHAGILKRRL